MDKRRNHKGNYKILWTKMEMKMQHIKSGRGKFKVLNACITKEKNASNQWSKLPLSFKSKLNTKKKKRHNKNKKENQWTRNRADQWNQKLLL